MENRVLDGAAKRIDKVLRSADVVEKLQGVEVGRFAARRT